MFVYGLVKSFLYGIGVISSQSNDTEDWVILAEIVASYREFIDQETLDEWTACAESFCAQQFSFLVDGTHTLDELLFAYEIVEEVEEAWGLCFDEEREKIDKKIGILKSQRTLLTPNAGTPSTAKSTGEPESSDSEIDRLFGLLNEPLNE